MNTTTVIWVTDRHNSSLVTFSLDIAEVTFTVIALAIISGNRWYKSLYPSFLIPHSAQLLLSRGHSHLSLMFPPTPKPSCDKTLLPFASRFLLILSFCNACQCPPCSWSASQRLCLPLLSAGWCILCLSGRITSQAH